MSLSLIGDQPKVDHSEAFWRTATVTHDHCSRSLNARVWWNQGLCDRRRFMKRWRQGMKAMSIRWRGDFNGRRLLIRANAMSRGGRKPLFQKDARGGDDDRRRPKRTCSLLSNPPRWEAKSSSRRSSRRQGPKLRANEVEEGPGATSELQEGHNRAPGGQNWKPV